MAIAVSCLLACTAAQAAEERVTVDGPRWIPGLIRRLAVCESRGDPRHHVRNAEGEFGGIVSWYVAGGGGTWALDKYPGMPRYPWQASLRQQVSVAIRSVNRGRHFGCLQHDWVRG